MVRLFRCVFGVGGLPVGPPILPRFPLPLLAFFDFFAFGDSEAADEEVRMVSVTAPGTAPASRRHSTIVAWPEPIA